MVTSFPWQSLNSASNWVMWRVLPQNSRLKRRVVNFWCISSTFFHLLCPNEAWVQKTFKRWMDQILTTQEMPQYFEKKAYWSKAEQHFLAIFNWFECGSVFFRIYFIRPKQASFWFLSVCKTVAGPQIICCRRASRVQWGFLCALPVLKWKSRQINLVSFLRRRKTTCFSHPIYKSELTLP